MPTPRSESSVSPLATLAAKYPPSTGGRTGRSHNGCRTCRQNKVKCDEASPKCGRCFRLHRNCDYTPRARKKYTRRATSFAPQAILSSVDGPRENEEREPLSQGGFEKIGISPRIHRDLQKQRRQRQHHQGNFESGHFSTIADVLKFAPSEDSLLDSVDVESAGVLSPLDHVAVT